MCEGHCARLSRHRWRVSIVIALHRSLRRALQHQCLPYWLMCMARLLEAVVWSSARWAHTYLMPEEAVSQAMHDAFGASAGGGKTADMFVKVAGTSASSI